MLQNLPYQKASHHQSLGNLSEGNVSDTISESSDNATLLSLSREDLIALGAGSIREDVRVNRKKMESLILRERELLPGEQPYMDALMERTNTYIQWPSRMKIGAKTKKDLFVRIYGHNQDDINEAKTQIATDLGPHKDLRITLKMEISYTDHSHLIGCRGQTIRRVMEDTGCHIHFPDSNRMSKEHKSNQVTIAGSSVSAVEQARARVRELSPLIFLFSLPIIHSPYEMQLNPDSHHVFIENIQSNYNVQITVHPPNKLQQTSVSVKGCEVDSASVKDAVAKIISYFSPNTLLSAVTVESTLEISSTQHAFVRSVQDSNVHSIMMNTGAKIIFPDLTDSNIQQIKRSRVYISGELNCVYNARQQLLGCLPLRMIFDLSDDYQLDWELVRQIGSELNVNVKMINRNRSNNDRNMTGLGMAALPPLVPGRSRTIQLIAAERNTFNLYEVRRRILGGHEPAFTALIPPTYMLRPIYDMKGNSFQYGNRLGPPGSLPPLMLPTSPNVLSPVLSPSFWPPTPFSSPFCSPPIATCVVNNPPPNRNHGSQEGSVGKMTLNLHPNFGMGYNSGLHSPSPLGPPPEINISNLKHQLHLPIMEQNPGHMQNDSALNTPLSLGGASSMSELSPMGVHPGIGMVNALINDYGNMDINRKAPGYERSNTAPSLLENISEMTKIKQETSSQSASDTAHNSKDNLIVEDPSVKQIDGQSDKVNNPTCDKKYMAVKAMYNSKIGPNPRVPTSEWAGCGFSKTYTNLFPQDRETDNRDSKREDGCATSNCKATTDSTKGTDSEICDMSTDKTDVARLTASGVTKEESNSVKTHNTLGHQKSNLLDFAATRPITKKPPTDLASLFIQNGLDKYIDTFIGEEIDLTTFATLTEGDLRTLGVTSYPARKRMLVLITQLSCSSTYTEAD